MRYVVIFEKSQRQFGAYCPDLPGCIAVGQTLAEAKGLIANAMQKHLEALESNGHQAPEPASIVAYIEG